MNWAISLKPQFVEAIREGRKTCEVRTRIPRELQSGDYLYVVETNTHGKVALKLRVATIHYGDTNKMYIRYFRDSLALTAMEYIDYANGRDNMYFITFDVVEDYDKITPEMRLVHSPQWFKRVGY